MEFLKILIESKANELRLLRFRKDRLIWFWFSLVLFEFFYIVGRVGLLNYLIDTIHLSSSFFLQMLNTWHRLPYIVPDPPKVTVQKLYHTHRATITMEIFCRVMANPTTSPTWVFTSDKGRVSNMSREVDRLEERGEGKDMISVLIIKNPKNLHLGHYECRARNRLGEDRQEIILHGKV